MTRYNHPAREAPAEPGDVHRECFTCGVRVIGFGPTLKHFDEEVPTKLVPREYIAVLRDCTAAAELALSQLPTERASDYERARAVVVALIEAGFVRTKRTKKPSHKR